MIATQRRTVATATTRALPDETELAAPVAVRMTRPNDSALMTPIANRDIFSQNDSAVTWRMGSLIESTKPVAAITASALQNHGANRRQTSVSGSSVRIWPSTRNATFSIETNTMPIITMWMVCSSGVSQSVDWIATLNGVACNHAANSSTARYRLVARGSCLLLPLLLERRIDVAAADL